MKEANDRNEEFINCCKQFKGRTMTLFIDNIRLYRRPILCKKEDAKWIEHLLNTNDLLELCSKLPNNKFIIFTSHEDTPIDDKIQIPENVLGIHAVNAEFNNDKIVPFPYGVQREINRPNNPQDNRIYILRHEIDKTFIPTKLLYINCGIGRNEDRKYLPNFANLSWTTTRFNEDSMYFTYDRYKDFLDEMREHKFMVCPQGHGMDCHRNWELLYLRRVPIMKDCQYFRRLMEGFPVLFINDWSDITENLLKNNDYLYEEAQKMNLIKLDLDIVFKGIVASYINV